MLLGSDPSQPHYPSTVVELPHLYGKSTNTDKMQASSTIYQPLDTSRSEIRLLEIRRRNSGKYVECRLRTVSLDDNPIYVALSYVWGDPFITRDIVVDGHVKPVTINLEAALRHVKTHWEGLEPNQEFLLWADAVCINQDDIPERNAQVRIMGSIYRKSRVTFVWLGEHEHEQDTRIAFKCARWIHEHFPYTEKSPPRIYHASDPFPRREMNDSLRYLVQLTRLPWFERAWTFQEVILPLEVILLQGTHSLPLECLQSCSSSGAGNTAIMSRAARLIFATRAIEDGIAGDSGRLPPGDLGRLLNFRREAKASDPRDTIFSLLGLFDPRYSDQMRPDYSMSVKDVFTIATRHIIRTSRELRILCSVESPKNSADEAFPSWVPDWRAAPESCRDVLANRNPRSGYSATRRLSFNYNPSPETYDLHVLGIYIGTVDKVGPFDDIHSVGAFNLPEKYTHTNQPIRAALRQAQTLNIGLCPGYPIPVLDKKRTSYATFFDLVTRRHTQRRKCTQCPTPHGMPILTMDEARWKSEEVHNFVIACNITVDSRSFFTTDSNHLGFGPRRTAVGDQLFLLIGSDIPFVLRPFGKKFELVGACYAHGIMYGEGLHQDMGFDSRFYPGSVPGGEWIFPNGIRENNASEWEIMDASVDDSGVFTQRFTLHEEEREPLVIEAREIVLK